jgi:predicted nuclease of predicted toxin-antitoxin system
LRFLVDAQLPPALAIWLRKRGHAAEHVRDVELDARPDTEIVAYAVETNAVIITKDTDFSHLSVIKPGCKVVLLRFGNATSASLLHTLEPIFSEVEKSLMAGQKIVEVSR